MLLLLLYCYVNLVIAMAGAVVIFAKASVLWILVLFGCLVIFFVVILQLIVLSLLL